MHWKMNYCDESDYDGYTQEELDDMCWDALTGGQYDDDDYGHKSLSDYGEDCLGF